MLDKEKKKRKVHMLIIALILLSGAALAWEFFSGQFAPLERKLPFRYRMGRYMAVPADNWRSGEWDPFQEMERIQHRMDAWFNRIWSSMPGEKGRAVQTFYPRIDMCETEKEYIVTCDLPGMDKDEINVSVSGNYLLLSGNRSAYAEDKNRGYYYSERRNGSFKRAILLPGPVDENNIKASYKNGILTVRIPKKTPAHNAVPKKVEII